MRILFYASYPDQPIGYSKVAHAIASWLANQSGVEVYYFGIGNNAQTRCKEREIPANIHMIDVAQTTADEFGMDILAATMETLKPDVFLIYNDLIVTCRAFNALLQYRATHSAAQETRFISYIDLVYPFEKLALIRHMDRNTDEILVFSECWRRNLLEMGVRAEKVRVFPHGFSANLFYSVPITAAKAYFGFDAEDFIILNANRNTYRKAQDVAIRAFVEFLVRENWDSRIKMFLHCSMVTQTGYSLSDVLEVEALRAGVPLSMIQERIKTFASYETTISDSTMNLLYNAADVGLNTCIGEGFGLCNMEHAALGCPQIVSKVGGLADIFADGGAILVEPRAWIRAATCLDEHSGDLGICDAADYAAAMSLYFHDREKRRADGLWGAQVLPSRYNWPQLLTAALGSLITQPQHGVRDLPQQTGAVEH
jgi:glycosyltransferase involved in cell wall biosynthesis